MKISIIITARNNGKYLAEAIESCLSQTVKPFEVVYSDDFSTDDSVKIASKYDIKVISHTEHLGVVKARNDGVDHSKGDVLVFLDGDDKMPEDFLEKHLQVFDESTPFVYCAAQAFGLRDHFWKVNPWGTLFLWNRNFVNTSAMMWRKVFEKAGRWQETCKLTMWDWNLVLRMSRLGNPRKSPAILLYRQHMESWSLSHELDVHASNIISICEGVRRELVKVSIGLIYSGRIKGFIDKWMEKLAEDISILNNLPELIIINNSEENLSYLKKTWGEHFSRIKIITGQGKLVWKDESERRNKVCELLSDCYNMILEHATGELIHLREDDIMPNKDSFKRIFELVTEGSQVKECVAGIYLNRNKEWYKKIVGGFFDKEIRKTVDLDTAPSQEPSVIDYAGTGFMIFWKELCPQFSPRIEGIQAQDWSFCFKLKKMGGKVWLDPKAVCRHYIDEENFVEYKPEIPITPTNTFIKQTIVPHKGNQKPIFIKRIQHTKI
jgi:glycosyltransferase involved in cell wall biosynthesis